MRRSSRFSEGALENQAVHVTGQKSTAAVTDKDADRETKQKKHEKEQKDQGQEVEAET